MPNDDQGSYPGEGHHYNQKVGTGPKRPNIMTIIVLILVALVVILGATTFLALRHTSPSTSSAVPSTTQPSPTTVPTTQSNPTATPTTPPNPTTAPTTQETSTTLAADATITENKLLTCSNCNGGDPIQFIISSITIDNANGRTVWNVTLKNVSGTYYYVYNYQNEGITLQESAGINQPIQATGYSVPGMAPGDKDTTQLIFAFVPHKGAQYTFSAHIRTDSNIDMPFDPVNFTF